MVEWLLVIGIYGGGQYSDAGTTAVVQNLFPTEKSCSVAGEAWENAKPRYIKRKYYVCIPIERNAVK